MNSEKCKRCLLLQSGEVDIYKTVKNYIETLDDDDKVDKGTYSLRLELCKNCDCLIAGMCVKCGCYVEVRAIQKNKKCPDKKWVVWKKAE